MQISRIVIRNFRSFAHLDVPIVDSTTCVIGENNSGKTNFLHAIRLCIDASLSSTYRSLAPSDIHSRVDISSPTQVLIGLEITGFGGNTNEEALVGAWQCKPGLARLIYRYRPKLSVREDLESNEIEGGNLTHDDYHWELTGGGDRAQDLATIDWNTDLGSAVRFSDLQSFLVVFLPALRNVESDLRQYRGSPLARLIDAMDIEDDEQEQLLNALRQANQQIATAETIGKIAKAIDKSFKKISGPAFSMDVALGLAEPSFQAIVRALRILLTNTAMKNFDPSLNGLGLNNILYISILVEYFRRRQARQKSAGQLILMEEPEAHLHPQLQVTLFKALRKLPFQSILTTHSTHITSHAPLESYIVLSQIGKPAIASARPAHVAGITQTEIHDLERYLDATKSNLLFARKVILVEGPAELFLIPALLKQVKNIDLDREGVSIVPIYGVHFEVYAKMFTADVLPKKCAIITDGDLVPSDANPELEGEDGLPPPPKLKSLQNEFLRVFACKTTFERALVSKGTLEMFALAAQDIGATIVARRLQEGADQLRLGSQQGNNHKVVIKQLRKLVLNTAKRFGKARFAQIAARHADHATAIPKYLEDAVQWLQVP